MKAFQEYWTDLMKMSEARWIISITLLAMGLAVAFYVGKFFRDMATGQASNPTDFISDFQRMKAEGKLNEEEFKKLANAIPKDALLPEIEKKPPADKSNS